MIFLLRVTPRKDNKLQCNKQIKQIQPNKSTRSYLIRICFQLPIFDSYLDAGGFIRICIREFLFVCSYLHVVFVFVFDLLYSVCATMNLNYAPDKIKIVS